MQAFWETELTEEEKQDLIGRAVNEIQSRHLTTPAVLLLEMQKPISNISAHFALGLSPFLVAFFGFNNVNQYSQLLRSRADIERLIQAIEEAAAQSSNERSSNAMV